MTLLYKTDRYRAAPQVILKRNKRTSWYLGASLLALLILLMALIALTRPPTYGGQTIDDWVQALCVAGGYSVQANARTHLLSAGEKAIPRMIQILESEPSRFDSFYQTVWLKLPSPIQRQLPLPLLLRPVQDKRLIFEVLVAIGSPVEKVVAAVGRGSTNRDSEMRFFAVHSLRDMPATNFALVVPILTNALQDTAHNVRGAALSVLGNQGELAQPYLADILRLMEDSSDHCRLVATRALEKIGDANPSVLAALIGALGDSDVPSRLAAARALFTLTKQPEPSLTVIQEVLSDESSEFHAAALIAASALGTNSASLLPVLPKVVRSAGMSVKIAAARFEWSATGQPGTGLNHLSEAMLSGDRSQQLTAARVIRMMGADAEPTIPSLITVLLATPQDWLVQEYAVEALQAMGPHAAPALPALTNQLDHRVLRVRTAAEAAIRSINQQPQ